jgi:hypothetical protein
MVEEIQMRCVVECGQSVLSRGERIIYEAQLIMYFVLDDPLHPLANAIAD